MRNSILVVMGIFVFLASSALKADQVTIDRLERGEILSSKVGSAIVIQQVVKKTPSVVLETFFRDIRKLPKIFPNIAFVRPYITSDGKNLLYLKMRGLGDGVGVLMQVKTGGEDAFINATTLIANSASFGLRDTAAEVDLSKDPLNRSIVEAPREPRAELRRKISAGATFNSAGANLILEGPLNQIMEMPSMRMTINLAIGSYKILKMDPRDPENEYIAETLSEDSYLVSKISVGSQAVRGELGDYRGFGEGRMTLTHMMGIDVFRNLKFKLENI